MRIVPLPLQLVPHGRRVHAAHGSVHQVAERKLSAKIGARRGPALHRQAPHRADPFCHRRPLEADNNIAENAIRCIAPGRRNWLFAGSHSSGHRAAAMYSILQTAKLNGVNPQVYLTDTLAKIAAGHPSTASPN